MHKTQMTNKHEKMAYLSVIKEMQIEMRYHVSLMRMTEIKMRDSLRDLGERTFYTLLVKTQNSVTFYGQFFYPRQISA